MARPSSCSEWASSLRSPRTKVAVSGRPAFWIFFKICGKVFADTSGMYSPLMAMSSSVGMILSRMFSSSFKGRCGVYRSQCGCVASIWTCSRPSSPYRATTIENPSFAPRNVYLKARSKLFIVSTCSLSRSVALFACSFAEGDLGELKKVLLCFFSSRICWNARSRGS